jgi:beta-glucosidase
MKLLPILSLALLTLTGVHADTNQTFQPAPKSDTWWKQRHEELLQRSQAGPVDLLFLGDSIMQGWNCRFKLTQPAGPHDGAGRAIWDELYAPKNAANLSIGGDGIQNLLWRITTGGEIDGLHPKVIVLMIGTNNLGPKSSDDQIAAGIGQVIHVLRNRMATSKILLLGILPRDAKPDSPIRERINRLNGLLAKLDDGKTVRFLDIGPLFLSPDGSISSGVMADYLHPTLKGYEIWSKSMQPLLEELWK